LFPEGQLTRHGLLNPLKKGFELMARSADVPVVPVWLDDVWGSIFSFERGRFFRKRPRRIPYHVAIHFGNPLPPAEATTERVERALRELSADALAQRTELRGSLDIAVTQALRKNFRRTCLIEGTRGWTCGEVLATASLLAERWKMRRESRVRVALPTGVNAAIANVGLVLAGKVPVNESDNTNPTNAVVDAAEISEALELTNSVRWRARRAMAWWPVDWGRQRVPVDADAVQLSGGAAFTHRSLLAQVEQLAGTNLVNPGGRIVTTEPLHSAAGSVIGLWFPLLRGTPIEFLPNVDSNIRPVKNGVETGGPVGTEGCGVWLGGGEPRQGLFRLRPGDNLLALDDVPAVITVSQPDPPLATSTSDPQVGGSPGTLGRLLTGFAIDFDDESRLLLRGPALPRHEFEFLNTGVRARFDANRMLVRV
jgi:acyl-[acyl-carrier-protein]-phospholipid O-acyltransferase/long-chain-fatty-acid--[acyl-carrier-protein] ligase